MSMRSGSWLLPVVLAAAVTVQGSQVQFREGPAACTVEVTAEPAVGEWSAREPAVRDETLESSGGYRIALRRVDASGHAGWAFELSRADGGPFRIETWAYRCRVPLGRVATVFDTQAHTSGSIFRQAPQLDAAIDVRPNRGVPFMMGCDHYGNNSLAVGAIDQTGTYRITGRRVGDDYVIELARREYAGDQWYTGRRFEDALFVSTAAAFWYDTARAYADLVDEAAGYEPRPPHPKADRPYYSTWYAFADKIDQERVREQARLAREIGCGNFLIFIGWSTCGDWFSSDNEWGDYTACEPRFADFAGLVREIQRDLDMAVEVWVAPTWIGSGAKAFERMQAYRSKWPEGGYDRNLDPRSPAVRAHIRERFAAMAKTYGVDGFYVDFADTIFNRNDAPHAKDPLHFGTAYEAFLASMYEGFTSLQPRPIAEFRVPFANLLSKRYATVFNTTYTDGDWEKSRLIAMALRPFSRGVITRCDPLVWRDRAFDDRDAVGKALSAILMCGPPGISMDLSRMNPEQRRRLRAWLTFWLDHREDLVHGEFRPFGAEYHNPEMMVHRGGTAYARVSRWETGQIPFPEGTRHAYIFTALPVDVSFIARVHPRHITGLVPGRYRARWFDSSMESHDGWFHMTVAEPRAPAPDAARPPLRTPRENWDFDPQDQGVPSLDVRRGGFLELERVGD